MAVKRWPLLVGVVALAGCARGGAAAGDSGAIDAPSGVDAPVRVDSAIDAPDVAADAPTGNGTHLVINEIDYDQISVDLSEFIEIYNPTSATASLEGVSIMLVNGGTTPASVYSVIDLSSKTSLPAGGYLVVSNASVSVAAGAETYNPGWGSNAIQNGNPDGLALVDTTAKAVLDALSYGGGITSVQLTGFGSAVSLVEGTALESVGRRFEHGDRLAVPDAERRRFRRFERRLEVLLDADRGRRESALGARPAAKPQRSRRRSTPTRFASWLGSDSKPTQLI